MSKGPVDVLCIYRVKGDKEAEFRKLLEKHGPALKSAGLITHAQQGRGRIYRIDIEKLHVLREWLGWFERKE